MKLDHDIFLLNSTQLLNNQTLKLYAYKTYQKNTHNKRYADLAIAIKHNIKHKLIDTFTDDVLAVQLETEIGPVIIATLYIPPRRNYIPLQDMMSLLRRPYPVYIMGDLVLCHPNIRT